jgi:3-phenylpropionate/cinnamic acid dioxygenase small subunit
MISEPEFREVESFLYREARYTDTARYDDWEALLTDDFEYWVPNSLTDVDPRKTVSILYDNRARVATRIRQLKSGVRHAQDPASPMARVLSNIEAEADGPDAYRVHANFMLGELQVQSTQDMHMWIGRVEYKLRRVDGELKMAGKKVVLLNAGGAVPALAFLI